MSTAGTPASWPFRSTVVSAATRTGERTALLAYATLVFLPSMVMVLLQASSLAAGLLAASPVVLLLHLRAILITRASIAVILIACLIGAWGLFAVALQPQLPTGKILISVGAVLWLSFLALVISRAFAQLSDVTAARVTVRISFMLMALGWLAILVGFAPSMYGLWNKPVFPFREPSHFALAAGPAMAAMAAISTRRMQILAVGTAFAFGVFFPSLSFLLYAILISALVLPLRWTITLGVAAGLIMALAVGEQLGYYTSRLAVGNESENLSVLMWMQGFEDAKQAITSTNGIGIGFQGLGYDTPTGSTKRIVQILGAPLDRHAGGFLAAKLVGEFGVVGIALVVLLVGAMVRCGRRVRRVLAGGSAHELPLGMLVACAYVWALAVEIFIRSVGYFSPSLVLGVAALLYVNHYKVQDRDMHALGSAAN